jgi:hypothetical protein
MMRKTLALLAALFSTPAWAIDPTGVLPDPHLTPGARNPAVVLTTDPEVICNKTFRTSKIRDVSGSLKQKIYRRYGLRSKRDGYCNSEEGCEVDHLCSLQLGCNNHPDNLWIQPFEGTIWNAHTKDRLETKLRQLVCSGRMELTEAQRLISTDWVAAYKKILGEPVDLLK